MQRINHTESTELLQRASVSLESTLKATLEFYSQSDESYSPRHYVFNDQYVVAVSSWANEDGSSSEVTIKLLNEEVTFFWSALEHVNITKSTKGLVIEELATLFWKGTRKLIPKKCVEIDFSKAGSYQVTHTEKYDIPVLPQQEINDFLCGYASKLTTEPYYIEIFPYELLFAALNGSNDSLSLLLDQNEGKIDGAVAESYHDAIRTYYQATSK